MTGLVFEQELTSMVIVSSAAVPSLRKTGLDFFTASLKVQN